MSKIRLTEEKLTSLIEESVYELLKEAETDERLGHFLGNAFQSLKNRWNRFKGDIGAGRNYARYRDRGMDSYDKYGDEADNMRNFGGREYGDYRYNQAVSRNRNAANQWTDEFGNVTNSRFNNNNTEPQNTTANNTNTQQGGETSQPNNTDGNAVNNTTPTPNPNTTTQNTTTQNDITTNTAPQTNSKRQQYVQLVQSQIDKVKQEMNSIANYLTDKKNNHNFRLVNGEWVTNGTDGGVYKASESGYNDIRTRAIQYKQLQAKLNNLKTKIYEEKARRSKKINKIIQESVDKVLRQALRKK